MTSDEPILRPADDDEGEEPRTSAPLMGMGPPVPLPARLPHVPQMSIRYFMGWTAATALVLTVLTRFMHAQPGMGTPVWSVLLLALVAILLGWIYFGTGLILGHAVRGTLWPLEPGEWLMLVTANMLTIWGGLFLLDFHLGGTPGHAGAKMLWQLMLMESMVVLFLAAAWQWHRAVWSTLFGLPAAVLTVIFLLSLIDEFIVPNALKAFAGGLALFILFPVCQGLLIAGLLSDQQRRSARHWLHWSGVALIGSIHLLISLPVAVVLVIVFFMGLLWR